MNENNELLSIQEMIHEIRGQKVMLDSDLSSLYGVDAKRLNEAVKRNIDRFPDDFMFLLTKHEFQEVVTKCDHLHRLKYRATLPYAFTEQGVSMLSAVLNSKKAVSVSLEIIRTFVKLRRLALSNTDMSGQLTEIREMLLLHMESNDSRFSEHSNAIDGILEALYNLSSPAVERGKIGFNTEKN